MEHLEGRSTPAHFLGVDPLAFPESVPLLDWLAQPLSRDVDTTAICDILTDRFQDERVIPIRIESKPLPLINQTQRDEINRDASCDALFQNGDWMMGSFSPSSSAFPEVHNPDSMQLACLAVIGIPFLNGGQKSHANGEILLPQKRSRKKRKKQKHQVKAFHCLDVT